jgi:hypothetical protein
VIAQPGSDQSVGRRPLNCAVEYSATRQARWYTAIMPDDQMRTGIHGETQVIALPNDVGQLEMLRITESSASGGYGPVGSKCG